MPLVHLKEFGISLHFVFKLVIVLTKSAPASILSYLLQEEERKDIRQNIFSVSINV